MKSENGGTSLLDYIKTLDPQKQFKFFAQTFISILNSDMPNTEKKLLEKHINKIPQENQIAFFYTCYLTALEQESNESAKEKLLGYIKEYNPFYNKDDFLTMLLLKIAELNYSNALKTLYLSDKYAVEDILTSIGDILTQISSINGYTEVTILLNEYIGSLALSESSDLIGEESLNSTVE